MTKNYFEQESGRSMVEMLGVLAIIGVLSVGGISGYTTAMNKHKANEILNAAAIRAMAVSTQLQSGVTDPTLGEFPTGEEVGGAKFGDVSKVGDSQFKIGFTTQPAPAVVEQMKNIAGDNVGVDGSRLLYNNDLSTPVTNTNNRDENDPTKCAVGYVLPDCDACAEGYEKQSDGTCIIPTPTHNCPSGTTWDETEGTGPTALENGHCKCTSWTTNQCGLGYYCDFSGITSCASGTSNPSSSGTCKEISSTNGNVGDQAAGHWYLASSDMNQWTANSWCIGKGRPGLIKFSTLSTIAGESITVGDGYCEGEYCDTPTENHYLYTGFGGASGLPGYGYWTDEDYPGYSCSAYGVYAISSGEGVGGGSRDGDDFTSALCE